MGGGGRGLEKAEEKATIMDEREGRREGVKRRKEADVQSSHNAACEGQSYSCSNIHFS